MEIETNNNDLSLQKIDAAYQSVLSDYERQDSYLDFSQLLAIFFKRNLSVCECDAVVERLGLSGINISFASEEADSPKELRLPNLDFYQDIHVGSLEKMLSHRLLGAVEEQELSRFIKMGQRAEEEIRNGSIATNSHVELIRNANAARRKLVLSNVRLVMLASRHFFGVSTLSPDDLLQEGLCGLMKAVELFDGQLGYKFSTYATWWIRQSLFRAVMNYGETVRLPVHIYEKISKFKRAQKFLNKIYFYRVVSIREIAEELTWNLDETHFIMQLAESVCLSMSEAADEEDGNFYSRTLVCELETPEEWCEKQDFIKAVKTALEFLSPREQKILQLRFGMDGRGDGYTLEEIGKMYSLTRERIRQIEEKALIKIRKKCLINDGFILCDFMPENLQLNINGSKNERDGCANEIH